MKLTDIQKKTAQAIVNVFETGSIRGDYGNVTLASGDAGHLTYGRSQTTLASGNLYVLVRDYCGAGGTLLAKELAVFLPRLPTRDLTLDRNSLLKRLLTEAGKDPVMRQVQDAFFDRVYWAPALQNAQDLGLETALGAAVVYDSTVHGSWPAMRDRTIGKVGKPGGQEAAWLNAYVQTRRSWLMSKGGLLARTVYRMDTFRALLRGGNLALQLPLKAHGVDITESSL